VLGHLVNVFKYNYLTYSLTHSLTHLLTLSHTLTHNTHTTHAQHNHLLTQSCIALMHPITTSLTHSLTHPLTHSLTHSFTYSLTHPLPHSLPHSLTLSLPHSLTPSLTCVGYSALLRAVRQNSTLSLWFCPTKSPAAVPIPKVNARRFIAGIGRCE
jgi:hypothetical protein